MKTGFTITTILFTLNLISYAQSNYPGFDVIGKGYDVFGEYANNKSITHYPLFDFSKMDSKKNGFEHVLPKFIMVSNISDHVVKTVEGSSQKEYINELSQNVGLSGGAFFFKASVESQFNTISSNATSLFYCTYMDINTKWRVSLDTRNIDSLIPYLDNYFAKELNSLPPKKLFERYGTHFITNAYLGGRIDYSTISKLNQNVSEYEVKNAVTVKFETKFLSIGGSQGKGEKATFIYNSAATSAKLSVVGGNSEFANNINNHGQYEKWAEGIKGRPVLSGFDNNGLTPIWLLVKDIKRQAELEKFYKTVLLPNHPIPTLYKKDDILDNERYVQKFKVHLDGFIIHKDCDYYTLTGDESGDFEYSIKIYVNGKLIKAYKTKEGYVNKVWSGETLELKKELDITVPLVEGSKIELVVRLIESDDLRDEELGNYRITHNYPFLTEDLYNFKSEDELFWKQSFYADSDCNATCYYRIKTIQDATAVEFGNKGWEEYENGNYDKCLYYTKEALSVDNCLWYAHYNAALIYLIQGNPRALEKYKSISALCKKENTEAALLDITNHEGKFGELENSEAIKLWLRSKI